MIGTFPVGHLKAKNNMESCMPTLLTPCKQKTGGGESRTY